MRVRISPRALLTSQMMKGFMMDVRFGFLDDDDDEVDFGGVDCE